MQFVYICTIVVLVFNVCVLTKVWLEPQDRCVYPRFLRTQFFICMFINVALTISLFFIVVNAIYVAMLGKFQLNIEYNFDQKKEW